MKKTTLSQVFLSLCTVAFSGKDKNENLRVIHLKKQIDNSEKSTSFFSNEPILASFSKLFGKDKALTDFFNTPKTDTLTVFFGLLLSFSGLAQGTTCGAATNLNVGSTCTNINYTLPSGGTALTTISCGAAATGRVGWYKFTATNSTITIRESSTTSVNRSLSVWTACSTGSQLTGACSYATSGNINTLSLSGLTVGAVYFIMIRSSSTSSSSGTICVYAVNTSPCSASTLNVNSSCITTAGQTNGLTNSSVTAPSCGNYYGQDAWYKVVVPPAGYLIFETSGLSTGSAAMAIYSGTCGSVTEIDCNVNTASAGISNYNYIGAALTPGDTIFIRLWKTSNSGGLNMSYAICVHTPNCASNTSNDFCEGAATLTENASANFGSNTNLYTNDNPGDVEVPFSCGTIQNNSWYSFVASGTTATFPFSYTNAGCTNGIQAEVFEFDFINGCCINPISKSNCVSLNNTNPFTLNVTGLTVGVTYYLMIDGWNGAICNFSISGWSAFGVLPIKLIEFTGEAESRTNLLKWRTASEINSDVMVVQKSEDGINFTAIGNVKGAGNSTTENKYAFEDFDIHQTLAYYRLKQIDFDGTFEYSNTISVIREGKMGLFPNPTKGNITLKFVDPIAEDWTISFTDLYGRNVTNTIEKRQASQDQMVFSTEELKKGYYLVKVMNGNGEQIFNSNFIKE